MIEKEINLVVKLCNKLQNEYLSTFFQSVDEDEIKRWEKKNNIIIPEQYKEWLRFSNGALIRGTLAYFYPIEEFDANNTNYSEDYVIIGNLIGDGEKLGFSKISGKIVRINHGYIREYENFASFLNRMVIRMLRN